MPDNIIARHKVVYLTYTIHDADDGELLERSDVPVGYVHGVGSDLFEKIEMALEGHAVGDTVKVTLAPSEGFGERDPGVTYTDRLENVPEEYRRLGAEATFANDRGETITMVVTHVEDGKVVLDGNHPFAGRTVLFTVSIAHVRDATDTEIADAKPLEPFQPLH